MVLRKFLEITGPVVPGFEPCNVWLKSKDFNRNTSFCFDTNSDNLIVKILHVIHACYCKLIWILESRKYFLVEFKILVF